MAGAGGGPSRRSHTKSRKGCKTCKRRHIRCDETFPQCKNCTKHQVRCDYMDQSSSMDESKLVSSANLNWTPELEAVIDTWRQSGQFPFPELQIYPPIQSKNLSRTEARLLYHICQILSDLQSHRAVELTLWSEPVLKCLGFASSHHFVLNAIYAFSATLLAWETRSSETRALATTYAGNAMRGLDETLVNYTDANSDALMAACVILPWLQNDWTRWSNLMNRIRQITNTFHQYHKQSPFAEFLAVQSATLNFVNETSYPLTADSREDRVTAVRTVLGELGNVQPHLSNVDPKWIGDLKSYITQLHTAPIAQLPKEQFDNLYHVRKMLLWAPVGIIRSRGVNTDTLVLLSYFYASALALEPAFPDIGTTFLSSLVAPPLEKVMSFMQAYQSAQVFDPISQMLMGWPRKALDNHTGSENRHNWGHRPSISVSNSSGAASYELSALSIDLANQTLPDQYAYTPGLSPAFAPSTLSLIPPSLVTQPGGQRSASSPFLEVPSSSVDSFYGNFSSTSPVTYHQTPTTTYVTSPLTSPGSLRSPSDGSDYQLSSFQHHNRQSSIAEHAAFSNHPFDSYSMTDSQGGDYSTSNDAVAGGCVLPTAVWT